MKEILDKDELEFSSKETIFFSYKFLKYVLKFELLVLAIIIWFRINLIIGIMNIDKEMRGLINLIDYEHGWTFILIGLLIFVNLHLLFKDFKPIFWSLKQGGFIAIIFMTNLIYWQINLVLFVLIIYYCFKSIWIKFKILPKNFIIYLILSAGFAFLYCYLENEFGFLKY